MSIKRLLTIIITLSGIATALHTQTTPLPPLGTNPLWEIKITGQIEGVVSFDTLTYGQRYCRCGADYVAIVLNGEEEVVYMRQTEEQAFYLTDIDDCSTERLFYDYSTNNPQIPIENLAGWTDSVDVIDFAVSSTGSLDGVFQLPILQLGFAYPLGPFTINATTYWIRGVGDSNHPLFPIYNNLDGGISERNYSLERLTVDHIVWYEVGGVPEYPIIYVDQEAVSGLQDGSSWNNAFTNLTQALQVADPGDLVWVAEGVYKPANDGSTDRTKAFELRDGIQLYGGFAGTETYLSDRNDPQLHPTILSGDIGVLKDSTDNSFHVLRIQDVMDFALLDGFTISDGNAMGGDIAFPFTENGAGILIYAGLSATDTGQITLKNNVLTGHTALNGAAISLADDFAVPLELTISGCEINDNYAQQRGGGLHTPFSLTQALTINIRDTDFRANQFRNVGGGAIFDYHSLTNWNIINTSFSNNGSTIGGSGGAWAIAQFYGNKRVELLNSSFNGNYCVAGGGGVDYLHEDSSPVSFSMMLNKTHFENNRSFANDGAGISIVGTHYFELDFGAVDCVFKDNQSVTRGGAIYAAMDGYEAEGDFMFDRCLFSRNESAGSLGGGMRFFAINPNDDIIGTSINIDVQNSLFIKNRGVISQGVGSRESAIFTHFTNCTLVDNGDIIFSKSYNPPSGDSLFRNESYLKNTIIWEPDLPLWQILYNGDPENTSVYDYELDHCLISVDSCDLPGGEEACQTFPNFFNIDPLFVDTTMDDFKLKNCSPLLNQGINWPEIGDYDLAGQERVLEETVDIGAYETNTFAIDVDSTNLSLLCAGDSTGSLAVSTINSIAPVNFTLVHQNENNSNTDGQFNQLGAGVYQLLVADAQSCVDTLDFALTAPPALALYTSEEQYMDEDQGGAIFLDSIVGGTPPYQTFFEEVAWDGEPLNGLSIGTYLLSVIDGQGCKTDSLIEITLIDNVADQMIKSPSLVVSPNPVSRGNALNIAVLQEDAQQYQLEIWSAQGMLIFDTQLWNNEWGDTFIPDHAGLFLLVLKDREGHQLAIHKLIVQ